MEDSRVIIDLDNLGQNARSITKKYDQYDYYIGVLKGDGYGHGMQIVNALYENGINYFAVSSLREAKELRLYNTEVPVLCLQPIDLEYIDLAEQLNITLVVHQTEYLQKLLSFGKNMKIHIQIDAGMNRLGFKDKEEVRNAVQSINASSYTLEGIYQHFATPGIFDKYWDLQVSNFLELTSLIDLTAIPMVHMGSSVTLLTHPKPDFVNTARLGIVLYGYNVAPEKLSNSPKDRLRKIRNTFYQKKYRISKTFFGVEIELYPAMMMKTRIIQIKNVKKGEQVGYNAAFIADEDLIIAVLPVGYNNGLGSANNKRFVMINGKRYPVIGEMCMNMTIIRVDGSVKESDEVTLLGNGITLGAFARSAGMGNAEALLSVGKNNPRYYISDGKITVDSK